MAGSGPATEVRESRILLGLIGRPHGVRGLVRVTSYADDLTGYGPLSDASGRRFVLRWRGEGVAEIAELVGGAEVKVADRTAAEKLTNARLYVDRAQLPELEADEFYLADLIGLDAFDKDGARVGTVGAVHDYGAGASLEVLREGLAPLLLPFTRASVPVVDVARRRVVVSPPEVVGAGSEDKTLPPLAGGGWGEGAVHNAATPPPPNPLPQGEGGSYTTGTTGTTGRCSPSRASYSYGGRS